MHNKLLLRAYVGRAHAMPRALPLLLRYRRMRCLARYGHCTDLVGDAVWSLTERPPHLYCSPLALVTNITRTNTTVYNIIMLIKT